MQVLDDLGDRSEPAVREQYFNEIDKDGSGAIDFEEFLAVRPKYCLRIILKSIDENFRTLCNEENSENFFHGQ